MERDGTAIAEAYARTGVATGITFGLELDGLVPPYEEYAAMITAHYNRREWQELDPLERAEAVAYYRLSHLVALHESDAVANASRRLSANPNDG